MATRPLNVNGLDMNTSQAEVELARIKNLFRLLPDPPAIFPEWERLVVQQAVSGKNAHDAHIVAAMNVHGITQLLTFNGGDFKHYSRITAISPADVE